MRISARKRTARTPDTSKSARRNTETQRNNQRSLLKGGVGSVTAQVPAASVIITISSERGKQPHYPSRVRAISNPWQFGYWSDFTQTRRVERPCQAGKPA